MYNKLYEVWKRELESVEIERLPADLFSEVADYLKRLREEGRMLDKKTVRARLLEGETQNVKRMIRELIRARYKKIIKIVAKDEKVLPEILTSEEQKIYDGVLPFAEAFQKFAKGVIRGYIAKVDFEKEHKRTVLRFLREVPTIVGVDMQIYGPFKVEDVASLPTENAKILIKQGLAEKVEIT